MIAININGRNVAWSAISTPPLDGRSMKLDSTPGGGLPAGMFANKSSTSGDKFDMMPISNEIEKMNDLGAMTKLLKQ